MWSLKHKNISIKYISCSKGNYFFLYLPFLANSCTDCSIFHLKIYTQREKDLSEIAYETKIGTSIAY